MNILFTLHTSLVLRFRFKSFIDLSSSSECGLFLSPRDLSFSTTAIPSTKTLFVGNLLVAGRSYVQSTEYWIGLVRYSHFSEVLFFATEAFYDHNRKLFWRSPSKAFVTKRRTSRTSEKWQWTRKKTGADCRKNYLRHIFWPSLTIYPWEIFTLVKSWRLSAV